MGFYTFAIPGASMDSRPTECRRFSVTGVDYDKASGIGMKLTRMLEVGDNKEGVVCPGLD